MKIIVMNGTGGREMLDYVERPDPVAGPGQAPVEIAFAGVNLRGSVLDGHGGHQV